MVFAALSMVVLFAFAGLAIDGGRAYAERRQQQNAASSRTPPTRPRWQAHMSSSASSTAPTQV